MLAGCGSVEKATVSTSPWLVKTAQWSEQLRQLDVNNCRFKLDQIEAAIKETPSPETHLTSAATRVHLQSYFDLRLQARQHWQNFFKQEGGYHICTQKTQRLAEMLRLREEQLGQRYIKSNDTQPVFANSRWQMFHDSRFVPLTSASEFQTGDVILSYVGAFGGDDAKDGVFWNQISIVRRNEDQVLSANSFQSTWTEWTSLNSGLLKQEILRMAVLRPKHPRTLEKMEIWLKKTQRAFIVDKGLKEFNQFPELLNARHLEYHPDFDFMMEWKNYSSALQSWPAPVRQSHHLIDIQRQPGSQQPLELNVSGSQGALKHQTSHSCFFEFEKRFSLFSRQQVMSPARQMVFMSDQ